MRNPAKIRKILNLIIQLLILAVTYGFIYKQVFFKTGFPELLQSLRADINQAGFIKQLLLVFLLMVINWCIEAYKWKFLINKIETITFFSSFQAVMTGVSISSFTPNRIGEYFGRVFILKKASHIEGILITILGSMSQLLVTVIAGTLSLLIFLPSYFQNSIYGSGYVYYGIVFLAISLDLLLLGMFFNVSFLSALKERILKNGLKKARRFFRVFGFYHNKELLTLIIFSFLRYMVFSSQFYLLLRLFAVPVPFFNALILISLIYFIMAIIPTIALTELGIRGSVALYFFGLYLSQAYPGSNGFNLGIFSASTMLWMINLGLPAILGTVFVFRLQFFRKP
jgi:uncharacterized membrane protein YbhN (UPF0104 family)